MLARDQEQLQRLRRRGHIGQARHPGRGRASGRRERADAVGRGRIASRSAMSTRRRQPRSPQGPRAPRSRPFGTDRRQIDALLLPGFGALTSTPRAAAAPAPISSSAALHHGVGAFRRLDCEHMAPGHHRGLADIEGPERGDHAKAVSMSAHPLEGASAEGPLAREQVRRDLAAPRTRKPFPSKKRTTLYSTDHRRRAEAQDGQIPDGAEIKLTLPKSGRVTAPMMTRSRHPFLERCEQLPTSPFTQGCGKRAIFSSASPRCHDMHPRPCASAASQREWEARRRRRDGQRLAQAPRPRGLAALS